MNGNTTKLIAVVAVVVVAAAGVGTFLVLKNNDKDKNYEIDAALEVYGNANGDYKIDNADKDVIQKIIDKEEGYTLEKYPLADAYKDGAVDEKDIEQVDKILAGGDADGNQITVWHINHTTDVAKFPSGEYVAETKWPVKKCIANGAANSLILYEMVGMFENIAGINYSSSSPPDSIVYKKYSEMKSLGTSTNYLTESLVKDCLKANPDVTAMITADNKGYLGSSSPVKEADLENTYKIDVIRIEHAAVDPDSHVSAILMLGFLVQKETNAQEASEWITSVFKEIKEKVSAAPSKVKVAVSSGEKYFSLRNSDYADVAVMAGGDYSLWTDTSASTVYFKQYQGTSKTYEPDPRCYEDQYQPSLILGIRTSALLGKASDGASWYGDTAKWDATKIKNYMSDFSGFKCYGDSVEDRKIYFMSGDMPVPARVLYSAALMYGDQVSMDWANEKHQEFVDKFLGGSYKVTDCHFVLTPADVEAL